MPTHKRRRHTRNGRRVAETTVHTSGMASPRKPSADQVERLKEAAVPEPERNEFTRGLIGHLRALPEGATVRWGNMTHG